MCGRGVDGLGQASVQKEVDGVGAPKSHKVFTRKATHFLAVRHKTSKNKVKIK